MIKFEKAESAKHAFETGLEDTEFSMASIAYNPCEESKTEESKPQEIVFTDGSNKIYESDEA